VSLQQIVCKGCHQDGSCYDLAPLLGKHAEAQDPGKKFVYKVSICENTQKCGICPGGAQAGYCQYDAQFDYCVGIIPPTGFTALPKGEGVELAYGSGEGGRAAKVTITCDPAGGLIANAKANAPDTVTGYELSFTSTAVCPGGGLAPGLSGGSIFMIVAISLLFVYFIAGAITNKLRGHAGVDILPNATFWKDFPGLIKDGFKFVGRKVRGQ